MIYIITGTSTGIGKALAEFYLEKGEKVVGISRRNFIQHENFTFIPCDLSNPKQLEEISLLPYIKPSDFPICLINNAGIIGDIDYTQNLSLNHFAKVAQVNIVAPQFLSSKIIQEYGLQNVDVIMNISSGAGRRAIPSWSAYCSSKAAIDLFSETLQGEIYEQGGETRIFSVAPGVVDTNMQSEIRGSSKEKFSGHSKFVQLKKDNELRSPEEVAKMLDELIVNKEEVLEVIIRV